MKRIFAFILVLLLAMGLSAPALAATAADIDLSGLSYEELVKLRDRINLAMWESAEWEEVEVPIGIWQVGSDIPTGHWTIAAAEGVWCRVTRSRALESGGTELAHGSSNNYFSEVITHPDNSTYDPKSDAVSVDIELSKGEYVEVEYGNVVFTPYSGKPSLGFTGNSGSSGNSSSSGSSASAPDTDIVVGSWSAVKAIIAGEPTTSSYVCSQLEAEVRSNGTGYLSVAGEKANFTWDFLSSDEECFIYNYTVGSDNAGFFYFTDPSSEYYHKLVVLLDEENMIIYERD